MEGSTGSVSVRLGFDYVRVSAAIWPRRSTPPPARLVEDSAAGVPSLSLAHLEALATAGAFGCFGIDRRSALWAAGAMSQTSADRPPASSPASRHSTLPGMSPQELSHADLGATGVVLLRRPSHLVHPRRSHRAGCGHRHRPGRCIPGSGCSSVGSSPIVSGRHRPGTTFLNLEDEIGPINVVVSKGCWQRYTDRQGGTGTVDPRSARERRGRDQHRRRQTRTPTDWRRAGVTYLVEHSGSSPRPWPRPSCGAATCSPGLGSMTYGRALRSRRPR